MSRIFKHLITGIGMIFVVSVAHATAPTVTGVSIEKMHDSGLYLQPFGGDLPTFQITALDAMLPVDITFDCPALQCPVIDIKTIRMHQYFVTGKTDPKPVPKTSHPLKLC